MSRPRRHSPGGWFSTCSTEAWAGECLSPRTRTLWRSSGSLRKRCELAGCGRALTVLMPNHWHFVVWPERDGDLPAFMQQVTNTHVKRWKEHRHEIGYGHLDQGRYKCFPVETEDYFYQVVCYVEPNALRANLVERAESWRWSSLRRVERVGCPPFLGPPQMGDYAETLHANRLTYVCTLIDPFLVTGRAELFRRRVLQRAMRPDGVVFPPVPCRLFPSVRHALEFHPLQELVTQSTVKRFYISILPGASRGYRDRLRPHTRQPVHQRLANELRSI